MKTSSLVGIAAVLVSLVGVLGCPVAVEGAVGLTVTPAAVNLDYKGMISLQITGLVAGERITVQKFLDANRNGTVDAPDWEVERFGVTDGQSSTVAGGNVCCITNLNVPGDLNATAGQITVALNFAGEVETGRLAANYLYRVTSVNGSATKGLLINQVAYSQSVTGRVMSGGAAVPYAMVGFMKPVGDNRFLWATVADGNGYYALSNAPGSYQLFPLKPGYLGNFMSNPVVTLTAGLKSNVNLALSSNATRTNSGRLFNATNSNIGLPASQVFAQLGDEAGDYALTYTDANGAFSIPGTAVAQWKLNISDHSVARLGYLRSNESVKFDATSGNNTNLLVAFPAVSALVCGQIRDETNGPVAGVTFEGRNSNHDLRSRGFSDSSGRYTIGVSREPWCVDIDLEDPRYADVTNFVFSGQACLDLTATATSCLDFSARHALNHITGHLRSSSGAAISNIAMHASSPDFNAVPSVTDVTGYYAINVPPGTWQIGPQCDDDLGLLDAGWPCIPDQTTTVPPNQTVDFAVAPYCAHIVGRLVDNLGQPVGGVCVYACPQDPPYGDCSNGDTAPDGSFRLGASTGNWSVGLCSDDLALRGLLATNVPVLISSCADTNVGNVVARKTNAIIIVILQTTNHLPVANMEVYGSQDLGGAYYNVDAVTDVNGSARLGVVDGSWDIGINCYGSQGLMDAGYQCIDDQMTNVDAGGTAQLTFTVIKFPFLAATIGPSGEPQIILHGNPGRTYTVYDSTDLQNWNPYGGPFTLNSSTLLLDIGTTTDVGGRFFRVYEQ